MPDKKTVVLPLLITAVFGLILLPAFRPTAVSADPPPITRTLIATDYSYLPAVHGLLMGPTVTPAPPLPTLMPWLTLTATATEAAATTATHTPGPSTGTNTPQSATDTPRPPTNTPRPPTATNTPRPPTNTPRPPTSTPRPTSEPPPTGCSTCAADTYNCDDFERRRDAQACYDYCLVQVGYDVHRLDSDGDGEACESLPWAWWLGVNLSSSADGP